MLVHYTAYKYNEDKFEIIDKSNENTPLKCRLGQNLFIKAFELSIPQLTLNEKAEIVFSSFYGYGNDGCPPHIPPKAILKYEIEVIDCEKEPETIEEFIQQADKLKSKGNELFRKGLIEQAEAVYSEILESLGDLEPEEDEVNKVNAIKLLCHLNLSACFIRLKEFHSAKVNCDDALRMAPKNVKALFRRAQALCGIGEYDSSIKDIKKAIELDPKDEVLQRELKIIEQRKAQYEQKKKEMLAKMGKKLAKG